MKRNFVYILKSSQYNLHYIGHTSNLEERIKRHNTNRSKYTRNKGPWEIIAYTLSVKITVTSYLIPNYKRYKLIKTLILVRYK